LSTGLERQLALLYEPQRGNRRDQLHHGGDTKDRIAGHLRTFPQPPAAKDAFIDNPGFRCRHGHYARHIFGADCGA
jgi:hypothetical protein